MELQNKSNFIKIRVFKGKSLSPRLNDDVTFKPESISGAYVLSWDEDNEEQWVDMILAKSAISEIAYVNLSCVENVKLSHYTKKVSRYINHSEREYERDCTMFEGKPVEKRFLEIKCFTFGGCKSYYIEDKWNGDLNKVFDYINN